MNATFTLLEIREVLKHQKKGKSPGPDGIITECYDILEEEFLPILKEVIQIVRITNQIPTSWKESTITLILKKVKIRKR